MGGLKSSLHFYFHVYFFKLRDFLFPRVRILQEARIKSGSHVVDFGCGPGSYTVSLSQMVKDTGKVYAVDIHPLAIQKIKGIVSIKRFKNVEVICSDCKTGLPENSVDMVLLYDVFHTLSNPDRVLGELYRILKPGGLLSFRDHFMRKDETLQELAKGGYFKLLGKGKKTHTLQSTKK